MVAFLLLIWFVNRVMWKPMTDLMAARQKRIADGLAASEAGKQAQIDAEREAEETIKQSKANANDILAQAQKRAKEIEEEAKSNAKAEADRIIAAANAEIQREINQAKEHLRQQVGAIAVAGAERVLKSEIDAKKHDAIMKDLAAQI